MRLIYISAHYSVQLGLHALRTSNLNLTKREFPKDFFLRVASSGTEGRIGNIATSVGLTNMRGEKYENGIERCFEAVCRIKPSVGLRQ